MFVELIYGKIKMSDVPDANSLILAGLVNHVHGTFPSAEVKRKPMQVSEIKTGASKTQKAAIVEMAEGMLNDTKE